MTITAFKSFRSTVTPFLVREFKRIRLLVDPQTGSPVGIMNENATGADGIFVPIDVTAAQVAAPTPEMIADLNAEYRLNVPPYTRYNSNGLALAEPSGMNTQGPNGLLGNIIVYSPLTVSDPAGLIIAGNVHVVSFPA